MILFFQSPTKTVLAVEAAHAFSPEDVEKLVWAFSEAKPLQAETLEGWYVGPRREMITPWSTNAVEITQNMGLTGISRIEEYFPVSSGEAEHDPMLQRIYDGLNQLTRENNQVTNKTILYTYDAGGNIKSRTEYSYNTAPAPYQMGTPISTQTFSYTDHLSKQRSFYGIHVSFLLLVRLIGDIKTGRRLSRAPCSMSSPPAEYQRGFDTEIIGRNPADGYPSAFL